MPSPTKDAKIWDRYAGPVAICGLIGFLIWLPYRDPSTTLDWRAPIHSFYALQYHVPAAAVTEVPKPHDCDFLTAPLGSKNCSYKRRVTRTLTTVSRYGQPLRSSDDGQTWLQFAPQRPLRGQWEFLADGQVRSYDGYGDPKQPTSWIYPGVTGLERLDGSSRLAALESVEPGFEPRHVVAVELGWQNVENN